MAALAVVPRLSSWCGGRPHWPRTIRNAIDYRALRQPRPRATSSHRRGGARVLSRCSGARGRRGWPEWFRGHHRRVAAQRAAGLLSALSGAGRRALLMRVKRRHALDPVHHRPSRGRFTRTGLARHVSRSGSRPCPIPSGSCAAPCLDDQDGGVVGGRPRRWDARPRVGTSAHLPNTRAALRAGQHHGAAALMREASLSFLALGQAAPALSRGPACSTRPRYSPGGGWRLYPGLMISASSWPQVLGDGLSDVLDPRHSSTSRGRTS